MKYALAVLFALGLPLNLAHAAETAKKMLPQTSTALPAHLTTRIQWVRFPQPIYHADELKHQNRSAIVRIYADENGTIHKAEIQESTGLAQLDQRLLQAVYRAQVQPHIEQDTALPVIGYQVFHLQLNDDNDAECRYSFRSKNWLAQQQGKKVPFSYVMQPELDMSPEQLNGHHRTVKFSFKSNQQGEVKQVKIQQGSGVYALDQAVVQAVSNSTIHVKRSAGTLWLYKKSHFNDQIYFDINDCRE